MSRSSTPEYTAMKEYRHSFIDLGDCIVKLFNCCYGANDCELELALVKGNTTSRIKRKSHINCCTALIKVNHHTIEVDLVSGEMKAIN